jgi:hypothetical protein
MAFSKWGHLPWQVAKRRVSDNGNDYVKACAPRLRQNMVRRQGTLRQYEAQTHKTHHFGAETQI